MSTNGRRSAALAVLGDAEGPVRAWRLMAFAEDRKRRGEEMAEKSRADDGIARQNPYAYLPGLALRLQQRGYQRILDEFADRRLGEPELRSAFMRELARRTHASSILAHEGRHAIDKRDFSNLFRSHAEKEYRAKLSDGERIGELQSGSASGATGLGFLRLPKASSASGAKKS